MITPPKITVTSSKGFSSRPNQSKPVSATDTDLKLCHTNGHIQYVKQHNPSAHTTGKLAVGGAIKAAELAHDGEPTFGLIRPPGHHASPGSCWGFCYFNNMAISIKRLLKEGKIKRAVVLDIDLHYGDGTANIFSGSREVSYFHPEGYHREEFMETLSRDLENAGDYDIIAISAGFDRHENDWERMQSLFRKGIGWQRRTSRWLQNIDPFPPPSGRCDWHWE